MFVPNRGRKRSQSYMPIVMPVQESQTPQNSLKRALYNELFSTDELFIPNRGKKTLPKTSKNSINELLKNDLFYPNRGKKSSAVGLNNLFNDGDLFYPNRGKKNAAGLNNLFNDGDLFYPNRGKKWRESKKGSILNDIESSDLFFPNRGKRNAADETDTTKKGRGKKMANLHMKKTTKKAQKNNHLKPSDKEERRKRDLLDSLSKEKETFHTARGRRGFPLIKFGNNAYRSDGIKVRNFFCTHSM